MNRDVVEGAESSYSRLSSGLCQLLRLKNYPASRLSPIWADPTKIAEDFKEVPKSVLRHSSSCLITKKDYRHKTIKQQLIKEINNMQATTFFPTLKTGSRGPSVIDLQWLLNEQFAGDPRGGVIIRLEEDGFYGSKTEEAVKIAQFRYLLFQDGIAGPQTWRSLTEKRILVEDFPILRRGDRSQSVAVVQATLDPAQVGPIDSVFGVQTEAAVKAYQRANQLVDDGVVGLETWKALENRALAQLV